MAAVGVELQAALGAVRLQAAAMAVRMPAGIDAVVYPHSWQQACAGTAMIMQYWLQLYCEHCGTRWQEQMPLNCCDSGALAGCLLLQKVPPAIKCHTT